MGVICMSWKGCREEEFFYQLVNVIADPFQVAM
jgi:hypothetical protein